jgi:formyl-CoA transferase
VLLAVQNQPEWRRLCEEVLSRPELAHDPRFAQNPDRVAHRDELESIITAAIAGLTATEFAQGLEDAGVANARMNDVEQVWNHPVLAERDRWREFCTPGGAAMAPLPPTTIAGFDPTLGDVPALGAHSRNILCDLGYSQQAIDELVSQGVTTLGRKTPA